MVDSAANYTRAQALKEKKYLEKTNVVLYIRVETKYKKEVCILLKAHLFSVKVFLHSLGE